MLIDRYLPRFDVTYVCETSVDAAPDDAYAAVRETDLRDPVVSVLFALRELPLKIARRLRGEPPPPPLPKVTFGDVTQHGPGWVSLAEEPGVELVVGAVGQFWRRDYGGRPVAAEEFVTVHEGGPPDRDRQHRTLRGTNRHDRRRGASQVPSLLVDHQSRRGFGDGARPAADQGRGGAPRRGGRMSRRAEMWLSVALYSGV